MNPGKVKAVLLTHFHSDHIGDLGELMLKRWSGGSMKSPLDVFGPDGVETVVKGFNQAYSLDTEYRILHHGPETVPPVRRRGPGQTFSFSSRKGGNGHHRCRRAQGNRLYGRSAPVKPAVGYRFDYKGRSVVISGDTVSVPSLTQPGPGERICWSRKPFSRR